MTAAFYKSIALLLALVMVSGGIDWRLACRERDQARIDLKAEQAVSAALRVSIGEQTRATEALGKAKDEADARGLLAQRLAAANARRFDGALASIKDARATTCAEAMPFVNQVLEAIQ
ncbi:hypothetical protein AAKU55_004902 [Oxalobacteraceae bacterium GrIS 1.11]